MSLYSSNWTQTWYFFKSINFPLWSWWFRRIGCISYWQWSLGIS